MRALACLLAVLCVGSSLAPARQTLPRPHRDSVYIVVPVEYRGTLESACAEYRIPLWLMASLIDRESDWNPRAVNRNRDGSRDWGLCQINDRWYPSAAQLDGRDSIRVGAAHLAMLYGLLGDWEESLQAYNAGLSAVRAGRVPARAVQYAHDILTRS